jgi:hypothetical protein
MEPYSVVFHNQEDIPLFLAQGNLHGLRLGMPNYVGKAFLEDSESRRCTISIQV